MITKCKMTDTEKRVLRGHLNGLEDLDIVCDLEDYGIMVTEAQVADIVDKLDKEGW